MQPGGNHASGRILRVGKLLLEVLRRAIAIFLDVESVVGYGANGLPILRVFGEHLLGFARSFLESLVADVVIEQGDGEFGNVFGSASSRSSMAL